MSGNADLLQLACQPCGWRPEGDITMGLMAAHFETEHPEYVKSDGSVDVQLDMVLVCPRCQVVAPVTHSTERRTIHDCPKCLRTYRVPLNASGPQL